MSFCNDANLGHFDTCGLTEIHRPRYRYAEYTEDLTYVVYVVYIV